MLDIKFVRSDPDAVKENIKKKFQDEKLVLVDEVIELDKQFRDSKTRGDYLRNQRNVISKQIGGLLAKGDKAGAEEAKKQVASMAKELAELEVTGSAGGGLVEVTMTCDNNVTAVKIKPEAVDPDDVEMLEDLVVAAFNDAQSKAQEETEKRMGAFGGLGGII